MVDRLVTPDDAANRLAISPKTIRDWLRAGRIPGIKVGRLWRIRESELEALIADPQGINNQTEAQASEKSTKVGRNG